MVDNKKEYASVFTTRYRSSPEMLQIFSDQNRISIWRKLWVWLATAQQKLGLQVSDSQIAELTAAINDIDFELAAEKEKETRHDVMAHILTYKAKCPTAGGIIHQGATSCFVADNAELIIMKEAMALVLLRTARCLDRLKKFSLDYKSLVTVGRTHYQSASMTTVGKRACLWMQELLIAFHEVNRHCEELRFRGVKGATGTKDSFLKLFEGDSEKVNKLNDMITEMAGFKRSYLITGQTYPRITDACILNAMSLVGAAVHKICMDLRMLQAMKEIQEPFVKDQVGSSAMPWKKNPMRAERCCGFARFLMNLPANAMQTAAIQGFERTLDDSVNRRLVISEAFLTADALLTTFQSIVEGLIVHEKIIGAHVDEELPFVCMETILMALVKKGVDRQEAHEVIKKHSHAAADLISKGEPNNLMNLIKNDPYFGPVKGELGQLSDPSKYVGMCLEDVDQFIDIEIDPVLRMEPFSGKLGGITDLNV